MNLRRKCCRKQNNIYIYIQTGICVWQMLSCSHLIKVPVDARSERMIFIKKILRSQKHVQQQKISPETL